MTTYVAQQGKTIVVYDDDVTSGRTAMRRAIDEGKITEPGTYYTARPDSSSRILHLKQHEVVFDPPVPPTPKLVVV